MGGRRVGQVTHARTSGGTVDFLIMSRREHGLWFLSQMIRWGQIDADRDLEAIVDQVYRPDLYRDAALSLGPVLEPALVFPDAVEPVEARLFDGVTFDPAAARVLDVDEINSTTSMPRLRSASMTSTPRWLRGTSTAMVGFSSSGTSVSEST